MEPVSTKLILLRRIEARGTDIGHPSENKKRYKGIFGFDEDLTYEAYMERFKPKEKDTEKDTSSENDGNDVQMADAEKGSLEETAEEKAAREKKEQEARDEELARKLQAEWQQEGSYTSYYG